MGRFTLILHRIEFVEYIYNLIIQSPVLVQLKLGSRSAVIVVYNSNYGPLVKYISFDFEI